MFNFQDVNRDAKSVHMKGLVDETCIVPPREVFEDNAPPRPNAKTYNFLTECFFMAHKSLDLGKAITLPCLPIDTYVSLCIFKLFLIL